MYGNITMKSLCIIDICYQKEKTANKPGVVIHAYNPSNIKGIGRRIMVQ
jgi:hypothetical protein